MDLDAYERRFRRAGLPMLVDDWTAREDVWTRASPVLGFVLIVEALLAVNLEWPAWANALVVIGAVGALGAAVAAVNALRGRPAFALPEDVGAVELAAFVGIGGALQLIGGQTTSAWVVCAVNVGLLLVAVGSVFLGVRLPREVERIARDVAAGPPLQRRQRTNVGLVLFVTQALQIVLVALAVGAFFMVFGSLVIPTDVIESWTGTPGRQILFLNLGDIDVRVTVELLRVSAGIAALSGLYYSVAVLTDSTYREEFLDELTRELRAVFADRARYLELKRRAAGA